MNGRRCRLALCATCSGRRARQHRQEIRDALNANPAASALLWTATVASSPETGLSSVWDDLGQLLEHTLSHGWLSRRVDGYARVIEVDLTPSGWHPHAHTLLVFRKPLERAEVKALEDGIRERWLRGADLRGIGAAHAGQDVTQVPLPGLRRVVHYITKSHVLTNDVKEPGTMTPAMILRAAMTGEEEAVERYEELCLAHLHRRTWQVAGDLRCPR